MFFADEVIDRHVTLPIPEEMVSFAAGSLEWLILGCQRGRCVGEAVARALGYAWRVQRFMLSQPHMWVTRVRCIRRAELAVKYTVRCAELAARTPGLTRRVGCSNTRDGCSLVALPHAVGHERRTRCAVLAARVLCSTS